MESVVDCSSATILAVYDVYMLKVAAIIVKITTRDDIVFGTNELPDDDQWNKTFFIHTTIVNRELFVE